MHLLQALLQLRLPDQTPADAACVIHIQPKAPGQPANVFSRPGRGDCGSGQAAALSSTFGWHSFGKLAGTTGVAGSNSGQGCRQLLQCVPPVASFLVWSQLAQADRQSLRLVNFPVQQGFSRAVGKLQVGVSAELRSRRLFELLYQICMQVGQYMPWIFALSTCSIKQQQSL